MCSKGCPWSSAPGGTFDVTNKPTNATTKHQSHGAVVYFPSVRFLLEGANKTASLGTSSDFSLPPEMGINPQWRTYWRMTRMSTWVADTRKETSLPLACLSQWTCQRYRKHEGRMLRQDARLQENTPPHLAVEFKSPPIPSILVSASGRTEAENRGRQREKPLY